MDALRQENRDPALHVNSIGPAGENLCRGACVIQDKGRAFGRGGIGAVMGSKNLKAIVAKGTGSIRVADPAGFMKAVAQCRAMFEGRKSTETFHKYGTLSLMARKQEVSGLPYKNFQDLTLPPAMADAVDPKKMIDKYEVARQVFRVVPTAAVAGFCMLRKVLTPV